MNALRAPQAASSLARARQQEALALTALVRETVAAGAEREALHLRLAGLLDHLTAEHHHRLVREALEPLLRPTRARLFELPNRDLVAVVPPGSPHAEAAKAALELLFAADSGRGSPPCATLRLPQQAAALLAVVEDSLGPGRLAAGPAEGGRGFDPTALAALEQALASASLAAHLRQRPVCRLRPGGGGPEPAWDEYRVAGAELCESLLPGLSPSGAPWLHRRLRRLLDRRLLAELARPEELRRLGPIGLSLGAEALTEPEFLKFDSLLGQEARRAVTLGIPATEVLADPEGFAFAAGFCRRRGYRLALEEAELDTLRLLPWAGLGVDLVKLRWSPALAGFGPRLAEALPKDPEALVLTGVDRAAAVGWGWEHGIMLFQGRLRDGQGQ